MKFSIMDLVQCPEGKNPAEVFADTLRLAEVAEELGFDGMWLAEHHFTRYGVLGSPLLLAAAIAARTTRLRIGTAVLVLPFYDPIRLAEECATLDVLSGGRLDIGIGRGYQPIEFAGFGVDQAEARGRTAEAVEIMQLAWTGEEFSFKGDYFNIPRISVYPRPVQQPHPPIFHAAVSPNTFGAAGARGARILTSPNFTPLPVLRAQRTAYNSALDAAGFAAEQFDFPLMHQTYISDDERDAFETPRDYAVRYQQLLGKLVVGSDGSAVPDGYEEWADIADNIRGITYDQIYRHGAVFGTPDQAIAKLREIRDVAGVNHFIAFPTFGGMPLASAIRTFERLASDVAPVLRRETADDGRLRSVTPAV